MDPSALRMLQVRPIIVIFLMSCGCSNNSKSIWRKAPAFAANSTCKAVSWMWIPVECFLLRAFEQIIVLELFATWRPYIAWDALKTRVDLILPAPKRWTQENEEQITKACFPSRSSSNTSAVYRFGKTFNNDTTCKRLQPRIRNCFQVADLLEVWR